MTALTWDGAGQKQYETGVDQGVLYLLNTTNGLYDTGFAWNGITTVTEAPAGAAATATYADNIKYSNLVSAETFGATVDAYTYPKEFGVCDGTVSPEVGVEVNQQPRATFGLSYRTKIGTDLATDAGFKLHLAYGLLAAPSQKAYASINDNPAAVAFSWTVSSTPVASSGHAPTSLLVIDSTLVDAGALAALEILLYGTTGVAPALPAPDIVLGLFAGTITNITLTAPTFDGAHTITIPSETGVTYYVDGVVHAAGTQLLTTGQKKVVSAQANAGYAFNQPVVTSWLYTFVS